VPGVVFPRCSLGLSPRWATHRTAARTIVLARIRGALEGLKHGGHQRPAHRQAAARAQRRLGLLPEGDDIDCVAVHHRRILPVERCFQRRVGASGSVIPLRKDRPRPRRRASRMSSVLLRDQSIRKAPAAARPGASQIRGGGAGHACVPTLETGTNAQILVRLRATRDSGIERATIPSRRRAASLPASPSTQCSSIRKLIFSPPGPRSARRRTRPVRGLVKKISCHRDSSGSGTTV
jgi:hypothetical protein